MLNKAGIAEPSLWTRADAMKVHTDDPTATMPTIDYDFPVMTDKYWVWDTWPLRDINGQVVSFQGWSVIFALVADRTKYGWHNRNDGARIGYFYSRGGSNWIFGGHLLKDGANPRSWEWSGCTIMAPSTANSVEVFFTSVNDTPSESVPAQCKGYIYADDKSVWFDGFDKVTDLFQADGLYYADYAENNFWDFRDPHVFINPEDGKTYALFEGNVAMERGTVAVGEEEIGPVPPKTETPDGARYCAAAIGIAQALNEARTEWKLLPPLVTAFGVNDQTERPHVVFQNGLTYLFTISHHSTYADGLSGPDGVYGFVSENGIFGPYEPLNGSGLVLGNPSSQPYQAYSHYVMTNGLVTSFIDTIPSSDPNVYRYGGTLAPTIKLELVGHRSFVTEVKGYGYIPPQIEWLAEDESSNSAAALSLLNK